MQILGLMATSRNRKLWWCHSVFWALPPRVDWITWVLVFSQDKRCFTACVRCCLVTLWAYDDSVEDSGWCPRARQCYWDSLHGTSSPGPGWQLSIASQTCPHLRAFVSSFFFPKKYAVSGQRSNKSAKLSLQCNSPCSLQLHHPSYLSAYLKSNW